ncbi:MAG: tetratricopeptide repeat protein [Armatimonadota bacterium]
MRSLFKKSPETTNKPDKAKTTTLWILAITIATAAPYVPSLWGEFTLDDTQLILKDPYAHNLSYFVKAFTRDFLHGALGPNVIYYRPLVTVSFQVNYTTFGPNPFAFRMTNLLMHLITTLLVFALTHRITKSLTAAGIAALAFGTLPAHAEAVGWISGRTDVMSALFTVATILIFVRAWEYERFSSSQIVLGFIFASCAFFSKENALVLPFLMVSYARVFGHRMPKQSIRAWIGTILLALIAFIALRRYAVHVTLVNYPTIALGRRLLGVGIAYVSYLRMIFLPQVGRVVYDVFPIGIKYPAVAVVAWFAPIGLLITAIRLKNLARQISFALLWILLTLLPVVNILPTTGPLPAERFVYLPSAGSAMIVGWMAERILSWKPARVRTWPLIAKVLVVWFVLYCGALTVESCQPYSSDVAWARAVSASNTRFFRSWAGYYFFKAGLYREAAREYQAAIKYGSRELTDYLGLANSYSALGFPDKAVRILMEAKHTIEDNERVELSLGNNYILLEDLEMAENAFQTAAKLNPKSHLAWIGIARVSLRLGKFEQAIEAYTKADQLGGLKPKDRFEYGLAYERAGHSDKALDQFKRVAVEDQNGKIGRLAAARIKTLRHPSTR